MKPMQQAPIFIVSEEEEIVSLANIMPTKNKRVATVILCVIILELLKASSVALFVKIASKQKESNNFDMGDGSLT